MNKQKQKSRICVVDLPEIQYVTNFIFFKVTEQLLCCLEISERLPLQCKILSIQHGGLNIISMYKGVSPLYSGQGDCKKDPLLPYSG